MKYNRYNRSGLKLGKKNTIGNQQIKSIYGETMRHKKKDDWRVLLCNINTMPAQYNNSKLDMYKRLATNEVDINLLNEINKDQRRISNEERTSNLVQNWWDTTMCRDEFLIDKQDDTDTARQPGGVATILNNEVIDNVMKHGGDKRNLGRWRWVTVRGKGNVKTTIITCYRPENGWVTQDNQLAAIRNTKEGQEQLLQVSTLWFDDLEELIATHQDAGTKIILAGDFNDNLRNRKGKVRAWAKRLGLVEVLLEKYGEDKAPATHAMGSRPIDGIFCSRGMTITKGGYIDRLDCPGDHSALFLDIPRRQLVGTAKDRKTRPIKSKLRSKIPSIRDKFRDNLEQEVIRMNLYEKTVNLKKQCDMLRKAKRPITRDETATLEALYHQIRRALNYADKTCTKARTGQVAYSPEVRKALGKVMTLQVIRARIMMKGKKSRPRTKEQERIIRKFQYKGPTTFETLDEASEALRQANREYNKLRPNAKELRDIYLSQLAIELEEEDGIAAAIHLHALKHIEKVRNNFNCIKIYEKKTRGGGVSVVEKIVAGGERIRITKKEEIEEEISRANQEKLLQANNTPLREEPLLSLLGEQGDFDRWEQILKGAIKLPSTGIEEGTRLWYEFMTSEYPEEIEIEWTAEEYFDGWKKMKEATGCLPGWTFAHMKSMKADSKAGEVISLLSLIPLQIGYVPEEWKVGIDSMIPKKTHNLLPSKLRLILLLDCRFNHNNKYIGKKLMEFGERNNLLAKEQYGSRKGKSAIQHALNKRLVLDNIRLNKIPAIYCANDAKSCYDRIIFMVAYLTMRRFGIPAAAAKCTITGLIELKHYIRTVHGDSTTYYGGDKWVKDGGLLPHGNGQGNGDGPGLWAGISSPLMIILRSLGYGILFRSSISDELMQLAAFGFVDDMDYIQTALWHENEQDVFEKTQKGMVLWESLLRTTGGAIETSETKTDWVRIFFDWDKGKWKLKKKDDNIKMRVRNSTGDEVVITQLEPTDARETLGVMQSADGNETAQVTKMTSKIDKWTDNIWNSSITRSQVRIAIDATIGKTLDYPLPATALSENECEHISKTFEKVALPKAGIIRTADKTMVRSPETIGGLGIKDTYTKQCSSHIQFLIDHGASTTVTGQLIRVLGEGVLLESGTGVNLFDIKPSQCSWLGHNWITNTLEMLEHFNIELQNDIPRLTKWRTNDAFLMDEICKGNWSSGELVQINMVRQYMQVTTLSDICTYEGNTILKTTLSGDKHSSCSSSKYNWPRIPKPPKTFITMWSQAIKRAFTSSRSRVKDQFVLKRWTSASRQLHQWWYHPHDNRVFKKIADNKWEIWTIAIIQGQRTRGKKRYKHNGTFITTLPEAELFPAETDQVNALCTLRSWYTIEPIASQTDYDPFDWSQYGWVIDTVQITEDNVKAYCKDILASEGKIVCDGSLKNGISTSALRTIGPNPVTAQNIVPGQKRDQSSYRAELGGIYMSMKLTNAICRKNQICTGKVTLGCDCKGAIQAIQGGRVISSRWNSYDLLYHIQKEIRQSPIDWEFKWVRGHQDRKKKKKDLDIWAQTNIEADKDAKRYWQYVNRHGVPTIEYSKDDCGLWKVCIDGKVITKNIPKRIYNHYWIKRAKKYWKRRFNLTSQQINDIDWSIFKRAQMASTQAKRIWRSKHMQNIGPTANNMYRRKHRDNNICPQCDQIEDYLHILCCQGPGTQDVIDRDLEDIHEWMEKLSTTSFRQAIELLICAARDNKVPDFEDIIDDDIKAAALKQWNLGPQLILWGLWVKDWVPIQAKTLEGTRKCPRVWISKLVNEIWKITEDMWKLRNEAEHKDEKSRVNKERNEKIDEKIDTIYDKLPKNLRIMPHDDMQFFSKKREFRKQRRLKDKIRWVTKATNIIKGYENIATTNPSAALMHNWLLGIT